MTERRKWWHTARREGLKAKIFTPNEEAYHVAVKERKSAGDYTLSPLVTPILLTALGIKRKAAA